MRADRVARRLKSPGAPASIDKASCNQKACPQRRLPGTRFLMKPIRKRRKSSSTPNGPLLSFLPLLFSPTARPVWPGCGRPRPRCPPWGCNRALFSAHAVAADVQMEPRQIPYELLNDQAAGEVPALRPPVFFKSAMSLLSAPGTPGRPAAPVRSPFRRRRTRNSEPNASSFMSRRSAPAQGDGAPPR